MSEKIVTLNEEVIKGQLKELVRGSVEETLNELLEKEAEKLTQAARYERNEARQGYRSGLFLPQVWEQLPDLETFLGYLCAEKAALPWDAWKSPQTELQVFTVHAFEEPAR